MQQVIRLHPEDNVVIATGSMPKGMNIPGEDILIRCAVPPMHKIATASIKTGDPVIKYQQVIGFATTDIQAGDHVHCHNCGMDNFDRNTDRKYSFCEGVTENEILPPEQQRTFTGYRRRSGRVGTRNYIAVITSVNCSATVARMIADTFNRGELLNDYPNVDGVVALTHNTGCCMGTGDMDEGFGNLTRVLHGYAIHPNFAGVLMAGLGCEAMQISSLMKSTGLAHSDTFKTVVIQSSGGTRKAVDEGVEKIRQMLPAANACQRETIPISELTVALECGGSDGYSGITANPALGVAVDMLVSHGGTAILSETPETYGAEHLLTRRAYTPEVAEKLIDLIRWWENYTAINGGKMDNNPTPGNKAGGLTTILEKALGAQAKGGSTNLMGVYKYAEPVDTKGFVFMDSPGFDPASVTGMVASGATVVCFTTGRGSAFGFKPSPSIKLATNTQLFDRMRDDMDINCGTIAEGTQTVQEKGAEIFEHIIAVASGKVTSSEELGYGDNEFTPWQIGAMM